MLCGCTHISGKKAGGETEKEEEAAGNRLCDMKMVIEIKNLPRSYFGGLMPSIRPNPQTAEMLAHQARQQVRSYADYVLFT